MGYVLGLGFLGVENDPSFRWIYENFSNLKTKKKRSNEKIVVEGIYVNAVGGPQILIQRMKT